MRKREIARALLHFGSWPQHDAKCCFDHVRFMVFYCEISESDNEIEENTITGRSKIVTLMAIRHLIIFRYMATFSEFSNFFFRGEAEHGTAR